MFGKALLVGALVLAGPVSAKAGGLFGAGAGMEIYYYQTSVNKTMANGEVFFQVLGYVENTKSKEKVSFRALFNCGNASKIVVDMAGLKKLFPITDRVKYVDTNVGNWYSLQSLHCPNNHFAFNPKELVF